MRGPKTLFFTAFLILSNALSAHAFQEFPSARFKTLPAPGHARKASDCNTKTVIVNGPVYLYQNGRCYRSNRCETYTYLT